MSKRSASILVVDDEQEIVRALQAAWSPTAIRSAQRTAAKRRSRRWRPLTCWCLISCCRG